jgi:hypothetical protein
LCVEAAQERGGVQVVDERTLAVDLDHRQPLAVAGLQLGVAADVDLLQIKLAPAPKLCERASRTLAEVTAFSVVDDDARSRDRAPA